MLGICLFGKGEAIQGRSKIRSYGLMGVSLSDRKILSELDFWHISENVFDLLRKPHLLSYVKDLLVRETFSR